MEYKEEYTKLLDKAKENLEKEDKRSFFNVIQQIAARMELRNLGIKVKPLNE